MFTKYSRSCFYVNGTGGSKGKGKGKGKGKKGGYFNRIATFLPCSQISPTCDTDVETSAEIVTVSEDGMTAIYSDAEYKSIGFVDISDEYNPKPLGVVTFTDEPTSVAVCGSYAIVAVNTSPDFVNPSGEWRVIDIATQTVVASGDLGGQPDSVAVSHDCKKAAVAIENERDEDLGDGEIPQLPAGFLVVMDISNPNPAAWTTTDIPLINLPGVFEPSDPEPEFVAINKDNIAVVTLQENNAIVLVDLNTNTVIRSFSAGSVNLSQVDTIEDGIISQTGALPGQLREPDAVTWIGTVSVLI